MTDQKLGSTGRTSTQLPQIPQCNPILPSNVLVNRVEGLEGQTIEANVETDKYQKLVIVQ